MFGGILGFTLEFQRCCQDFPYFQEFSKVFLIHSRISKISLNSFRFSRFLNISRIFKILKDIYESARYFRNDLPPLPLTPLPSLVCL